MGLPNEHDLQRAILLGHAPQTNPIREQQFRALVNCRTPGKTDGEYLLFHLDMRLALNLLQQGAFGGSMSLSDFVERDSADVAEVQIVPPPLRDVPVVEFAECRRRPGDRMNSI